MAREHVGLPDRRRRVPADGGLLLTVLSRQPRGAAAHDGPGAVSTRFPGIDRSARGRVQKHARGASDHVRYLHRFRRALLYLGPAHAWRAGHRGGLRRRLCPAAKDAGLRHGAVVGVSLHGVGVRGLDTARPVETASRPLPGAAVRLRASYRPLDPDAHGRAGSACRVRCFPLRQCGQTQVSVYFRGRVFACLLGSDQVRQPLRGRIYRRSR